MIRLALADRFMSDEEIDKLLDEYFYARVKRDVLRVTSKGRVIHTKEATKRLKLPDEDNEF